MRCYFLRQGRIAFVEPLENVAEDNCVQACRDLFESKGKPRGAEGFEVWNRDRFIYRYPEK
ncbi:MAG: hypothetical protein JO256_00425 [Alphaproteobacteria bacterium]|nr:hypothetical protein [Alphaproteobacteria bacterium]